MLGPHRASSRRGRGAMTTACTTSMTSSMTGPGEMTLQPRSLAWTATSRATCKSQGPNTLLQRTHAQRPRSTTRSCSSSRSTWRSRKREGRSTPSPTSPSSRRPRRSARRSRTRAPSGRANWRASLYRNGSGRPLGGPSGSSSTCATLQASVRTGRLCCTAQETATS